MAKHNAYPVLWFYGFAENFGANVSDLSHMTQILCIWCVKQGFDNNYKAWCLAIATRQHVKDWCNSVKTYQYCLDDTFNTRIYWNNNKTTITLVITLAWQYSYIRDTNLLITTPADVPTVLDRPSARITLTKKVNKIDWKFAFYKSPFIIIIIISNDILLLQDAV